MEKIKLNDLKVFEVDVWVGAGKFDAYLVNADNEKHAIKKALHACTANEVIDVTVRLLQ